MPCSLAAFLMLRPLSTSFFASSTSVSVYRAMAKAGWLAVCFDRLSTRSRSA